MDCMSCILVFDSHTDENMAFVDQVLKKTSIQQRQFTSSTKKKWNHFTHRTYIKRSYT